MNKEVQEYTGNNWEAWSKYVLVNIDKLSNRMETLQSEQQNLRIDVIEKTYNTLEECKKENEEIDLKMTKLHVKGIIMSVVISAVVSLIICFIIWGLYELFTKIF